VFMYGNDKYHPSELKGPLDQKRVIRKILEFCAGEKCKAQELAEGKVPRQKGYDQYNGNGYQDDYVKAIKKGDGLHDYDDDFLDGFHTGLEDKGPAKSFLTGQKGKWDDRYDGLGGADKFREFGFGNSW